MLSTLLIAFSIDGIFCLSKAMYWVTVEDGLNKNSKSHLSLADAPIFKSAKEMMAKPGYIQKCGTTGINRKYLGYALPVNLQHLRCKTI